MRWFRKTPTTRSYADCDRWLWFCALAPLRNHPGLGIAVFGKRTDVHCPEPGLRYNCVNYDNGTEQETICAGKNLGQNAGKVQQCFDDITQAKFDWTGPCIKSNVLACGDDNNTTPKSGLNYYVFSRYDSVTYRVATFLSYLWCHGYDVGSTNWGTYLLKNETPVTGSCPTGTTYSTAYKPLWSQIIIGGWSQGGDMATFAATEQPIQRAINLSAPPQAVLVGGTELTEQMTPAGYLTYFVNNPAAFNKVFLFVSANDSAHYDPPNLPNNPQPSVYEAV